MRMSGVAAGVVVAVAAAIAERIVRSGGIP